jgi:hypothetical protein
MIIWNDPTNTVYPVGSICGIITMEAHDTLLARGEVVGFLMKGTNLARRSRGAPRIPEQSWYGAAYGNFNRND